MTRKLPKTLKAQRTRKKGGGRFEDIAALINLLRLRGELVFPEQKVSVCRDPRDNYLLEIAIEGHADTIVSGDEDLLVLKDFQGIPLQRVSEFLASF